MEDNGNHSHVPASKGIRIDRWNDDLPARQANLTESDYL
jgi:hypothetical protein